MEYNKMNTKVLDVMRSLWWPLVYWLPDCTVKYTAIRSTSWCSP